MKKVFFLLSHNHIRAPLWAVPANSARTQTFCQFCFAVEGSILWFLAYGLLEALETEVSLFSLKIVHSSHVLNVLVCLGRTEPALPASKTVRLFVNHLEVPPLDQTLSITPLPLFHAMADSLGSN